MQDLAISISFKPFCLVLENINDERFLIMINMIILRLFSIIGQLFLNIIKNKLRVILASKL